MSNFDMRLMDLKQTELKVFEGFIELREGLTEATGKLGLKDQVKCGNCGELIPDSPKCPKCGVSFGGEIFECPICKAMANSDTLKCDNCGAEFKEIE
ncbi:unnamed protein product [marine sediment metagenome]|uniref:DZANK-type domain-containing protein n=1 Tax=marine sediment metagenome TaxID=412755 RepID=X0UWU9_9ZZZZ